MLFCNHQFLIKMQLLFFQLCQFLHENASYLRPIDVAFKAFHETIKEDTLTTLVCITTHYINCLLPINIP